MDIELTDKQIKELVKLICNTKLGTLKELMALTSYDIIELDYIRENYSEIKKAIEIKEKEVTETILQNGLMAIHEAMNNRLPTKSDVDLIRVVLEGVGKSKGYGAKDNNNNISITTDVYSGMTDKELKLELEKLNELKNGKQDVTRVKSYLEIEEEEEQKNNSNKK